MDVQKKRLVRSVDNKMISGVCGGLASYFGIDVTLVRIVFVVFGLVNGIGVLAYLIMWVVVPVSSDDLDDDLLDEDVVVDADEAVGKVKAWAQDQTVDVGGGDTTDS